MKTHRSSDAHICGLSKAVQNCVIYNYYLGKMRCFRTKVSIPVAPLTHDVTLASNCVNRILGVYKKTPKSRLNVFYLPVDSPSFRHNFDSCDATANATLTRTMSLCKLKYSDKKLT